MKKTGRATIAFATALALMVTAFALALSSAPPAHAAGLLCNGTTIYGVVPDNPALADTATSLLSINGSSVGNAQLSATLQSRSPLDSGYQNGLAVSADGTTAYSAADVGTTIRRYDSATDMWTSYPGRPLPTPGDYVVAGAIDPTTGIFYFGDVGGTPSSPAAGQLFGFDTRSNQLISTAPLITFPAIAGEFNGDIAFDGAGNLYIVTSGATTGELLAAAAPVPRTAAQAQQLALTLLSTFPLPAGATASVNGIAFDATGTLYLSLSGASTGGVFTIDPGTGTPRSALTPLSATLAGPSGTGLVDLASCAFPPSVSVQKNVVSRVNPTDQFTLQATGPSISLPATATTTGTATGLQKTTDGQTLQAGPALARFDDTYTVTETAAGTTNLSQYLTTYSCVDVVDPTNPQFPITGTGTTASFTLAPVAGGSPSVVCTFTNAPRAPSLELTKTANPTTVNAAGDVVTYTFQVTNNGNTTLTGIGVDETAFSGTGTLPAPTCDTSSLDPGQSTRCTTTYSVTGADVAAGTITNTAVANGQDAVVGAVTSPPASAVVTATPRVAALQLTKTAAPATVKTAGDMVTYTFHVTNSGNVTVDHIAITEGAFSGTGTISAITCAATTLAPAASTDCTATYRVTQADIDAGKITNDATATGDDPAGDPVTSPVAEAGVTAPATPALSLTKTVSPTTGKAAGDTVTYSFLVTNTGNTTITGIAIAERTFTGTGGSPAVTCPTGGSALAPGDSIICTAPYTLTQADTDAGHVDNTAAATGTDTGNGPVTSNESDVTLPIPPAPALTLKKTASTATFDAAGQTITYSFRVTNTGNVTLTDVAVAEQRFSGTGAPLSLTCPADTTLATGQALTCTADYRTTDADVAAGSITNTADATGVEPSGSSVTSPESSAVVEAEPSPTPPASPAPPAPPAAAALATTGGTFPGWLAPLAGLLLLAGAGLTIIVTRRNRAKKTE